AGVGIHDPQVLIFDEPTAGLDVFGARTVLGLIEGLKAKGRTVIFSTHIMTEAERICDEIAIIEKGSILAQGTLDDLRRRAGKTTLEDMSVEVVAGANGGHKDAGG